MPIINITWYEGPTDEQKKKVANSLTKSIVEINGKTMLQLVIESLTKSGFKSVILSLKNKEQWEEITNSMTIKKKPLDFFQIDKSKICLEPSE